MKEPLIDRAREAFAAYRGLGRNIIDELIFALTVANKEVERLRESHIALLAAAKHVIAQADSSVHKLDDGHPYRTPECTAAYQLLCAAIAKAEELGE